MFDIYIWLNTVQIYLFVLDVQYTILYPIKLILIIYTMNVIKCLVRLEQYNKIGYNSCFCIHR